MGRPIYPHRIRRGVYLICTSCTVDPAYALCALGAQQTRCVFFHPHACAAGPNSTAGVHAIAFDNVASKCELHALDDHGRAQLHTVSMAITAVQGLASDGITTENAISAAPDRPQTRRWVILP